MKTLRHEELLLEKLDVQNRRLDSIAESLRDICNILDRKLK